MDVLEGLLTFHKFWPQCGAGGKKKKKMGHFKEVLNCFFFYANPF